MQRSGSSTVHHQRQYSDNFLDTSSNGRWLQSAGLQHLQSSYITSPGLQVQDYGCYGVGGGGGFQGSRMYRNVHGSVNGGNGEEHVSPSELSPGILDLHFFDTELLPEMQVPGLYDSSSLYPSVRGRSLDDSEPYLSGKQTSRARGWPDNNLLKSFSADKEKSSSVAKIKVVVRKRPLNKKEIAKKEEDVITIEPHSKSLTVHETKLKVKLVFGSSDEMGDTRGYDGDLYRGWRCYRRRRGGSAHRRGWRQACLKLAGGWLHANKKTQGVGTGIADTLRIWGVGNPITDTHWVLPKGSGPGYHAVGSMDKEMELIQTIFVLQILHLQVDLTEYIEKHEFVFDTVLNEEVSNDEVYRETVESIVPIIFQRTKATCFAYGQTGKWLRSGKTYTMQPLPLKASQDILRLMHHTYRNQGFQLFVSFFEIYGGKLFDLLNDRRKLCMREDGKQQVCIVGLQEYRVSNVEIIKEFIDKGNSTRSTGTTGANEESSRSHAILQLAIKRSVDGSESKPARVVGKLSFIDLAGSERGADTTDNDKQTRIEGAEINKSLLALKECIRALDNDQGHIPFRGSKLTEVLRDSFVGNSRTVMISCISPNSGSCEHTLNTLRYADRVKSLSKGNNSKKDSLSSTLNLRDSTASPLSSVLPTISTFEGNVTDVPNTTNRFGWPKQNEREIYLPFNVDRVPSGRDDSHLNSSLNADSSNVQRGGRGGTTGEDPDFLEESYEQERPSWKNDGKLETYKLTASEDEMMKAGAQTTWMDLPKFDANNSHLDDDLNILLKEEEDLVTAHHGQVEEMIDIVREEMKLLVEADQSGNQLDDYVSKLNTILSQKAAGILQLQTRLANFQRRLNEHNLLDVNYIIRYRQNSMFCRAVDIMIPSSFCGFCLGKWRFLSALRQCNLFDKANTTIGMLRSLVKELCVEHMVQFKMHHIDKKESASDDVSHEINDRVFFILTQVVVKGSVTDIIKIAMITIHSVIVDVHPLHAKLKVGRTWGSLESFQPEVTGGGVLEESISRNFMGFLLDYAQWQFPLRRPMVRVCGELLGGGLFSLLESDLLESAIGGNNFGPLIGDGMKHLAATEVQTLLWPENSHL
ncbi:hypothetical protein HHK36_021604 [Tetracentron sinense]|uniref:Kinesin motor domain-containing protein n=1 Tax=Tetracentron sinense TaxID=13715 RepID=A0A835D7Z8_TETSI|nr:hypothetical protein HHK36_021604 [Tetracentron sinense]